MNVQYFVNVSYELRSNNKIIENHEMDCDISEQELRKAVFSQKKIIKALALMIFVPNYSKAHLILSPSSYLSCTIDCFPMANTPDFGEKA